MKLFKIVEPSEKEFIEKVQFWVSASVVKVNYSVHSIIDDDSVNSIEFDLWECSERMNLSADLKSRFYDWLTVDKNTIDVNRAFSCFGQISGLQIYLLDLLNGEIEMKQ